MDNKLYDVLCSVALWASAFEILRPSRREAYRLIYEVLEEITWNLTDCNQDLYTVFGDAQGALRKLPVWIHGEITRLRNDTLHGNPLRPERLIVPPGRQSMVMYASPLYRMVLASILDLTYTPEPPREGQTQCEAYFRERFEFGRFQRDIEAALATMPYTDEEQDERRRIRPRRSAGPPPGAAQYPLRLRKISAF